MTASRPALPRWLLFTAAASAYGLLICALLPRWITPIGPDEFGYLKSAVETAQHGRPWTNDYLEPWAASLTTCSALVLRVTGSMTLAIRGLQVVLAALTFGGLGVLLHLRTRSVGKSILYAALLLTFPVLLRRSVEYIDLILYLPCLLWCLWAAEARRWGVFLAIWAVAVADRQSAIAWLVLPAFEAVRLRFGQQTDPNRRWFAPGLVIAVAVAWFLALAGYMNVTDIQLERTVNSFRDLHPGPLLIATLSTAAFGFLGAGFGALLVSLSEPTALPPPRWPTAARWPIVIIAVVLLLLDPRELVMTDVQYQFLYGSAGWIYAKLMVLAAVLGWAIGRFRVRWDFALCAITSILLIGLRQMIFDRYVLEVALLALLSVVPGSSATFAPLPTQPARPRRWRCLGYGTLAAIALFQLPFALHTKLSVDESSSLAVLYEKAIRAGQIRPSEIADAPFSLRGWYLHPYAITHRLANHRTIAGYSRFTEPTITLWKQYPATLAKVQHGSTAAPPRNAAVVADGAFPSAWFWTKHYYLVRTAPPNDPSPLGPDYRRIPLPLDDAEWRQLIDGPIIR